MSAACGSAVMRSIVFLAAMLVTPLAAGAAEPDPMQMATGQTLTETLSGLVQWRARAIADEQRIVELQKQLADAKAAAKPADAPKSAAPAKP